MQIELQYFIDHLRASGKSAATIYSRRICLEKFIVYCSEREISDIQKVTEILLTKYLAHLHRVRKTDGEPLTASRLRNYTIAIKLFFGYLYEQGQILSNPAERIELPKKTQPLPKAILTVREIERIFAEPNVNRPFGIRDRAALEIFYSTGIRKNELVMLDVSDVQMEKRTLFIRKGKGNRDRIVPVGERALLWLKRYLDVRYQLLRYEDHPALFLGKSGKRIEVGALAIRLHNYKKQAKVSKIGGFHLFRHAMATHMVERGADIRYVQEILGHENLSTTEIYTRVALPHLRKVYQHAQAALYG